MKIPAPKFKKWDIVYWKDNLHWMILMWEIQSWHCTNISDEKGKEDYIWEYSVIFYDIDDELYNTYEKQIFMLFEENIKHA